MRQIQKDRKFSETDYVKDWTWSKGFSLDAIESELLTFSIMIQEDFSQLPQSELQAELRIPKKKIIRVTKKLV